MDLWTSFENIEYIHDVFDISLRGLWASDIQRNCPISIVITWKSKQILTFLSCYMYMLLKPLTGSNIYICVCECVCVSVCIYVYIYAKSCNIAWRFSHSIWVKTLVFHNFGFNSEIVLPLLFHFFFLIKIHVSTLLKTAIAFLHGRLILKLFHILYKIHLFKDDFTFFIT